MLKLDHLTVTFPDTVIKGFNVPKEYQKRSTSGDGIGDHSKILATSPEYWKSRNKYGINRLSVNLLQSEQENRWRLELSGKVAGTDYHRGINRDNIEDVLESLNTEDIKIDPEELMLRGEVHKVDATENTHPSGEVGEYLAHVENYRCNSRYNCRGFGARGDRNTIIFSPVQKSAEGKVSNNRLTLYNKVRELTTQKKHEGFINSVGGAGYVQEILGNTLRVERRIYTHKGLREELNISERTIENVLNSEMKPPYNFFKKVTDLNGDLISLAERRKGKGIKGLIELEGIRSILRITEGDLDNINLLLYSAEKNSKKQSVHYWRQKILGYREYFRAEETGDNKAKEAIEDILRQLEQS